MGMRHIIVGVVTAGAAFAAGHFALGSMAPSDWRQDLLELPPPATAGAQALVVTSVEGTVERRTAGETWEAAGPGDTLGPGQALRTAVGSKAVLKTGLASTVELEQETHVAVVEAAVASRRLSLLQGRVVAVHRHRGRDLFIGAVDGSAGVRGEGARFTVFSRPRLLGVINDDAKVELNSGEVFIDVPKGMASWAVPGAAPVDPRPPDAPPEVSVDPLESEQVNKPFVVVSGRADPLAEVKVNDLEVTRDAEGGFSARVALEPGDNEIAVVARLFTGAERRVELPTVTRGGPGAAVAPPVEEPAAAVAAPVREKPAAAKAPARAKPAAAAKAPARAKPAKKRPAAKKKKQQGTGVQWGASP